MKDLVDEYKQVRLEFIQIISKFPENKREEVLFDKWSLKDIIAHLSGWTDHQIDVFRDLKIGKIPESPGLVKNYNDEQVNKRSKWSFEKVLEEFLSSTDKLIKEFENLPKSLLDKKIWPDKRFTPKIYFEFELEHYTKVHLPQIKKKLETF